MTVSELNNLIKNVIKENIGSKIKVIGEVSNSKVSRGHLYMTLKDPNSMINVVFWGYEKKNNQDVVQEKVKPRITDGNKVIVTGHLNVYPKGGYYNINCYSISVTGTGDIHKDYVLMKEFYEEIGYFKNEIKKKLPVTIKSIGVITALEGAALKDFLYVLENSGYKGKVCIRGAVVQGKECPKSIAQNLEELDKMDLDVIVITRGGGSFEDLFGFSNSEIIEAIYKANTCVISAIGHEVDFMLSDFVADIRAPTPSVAAEIIAKHHSNQGIYYLDNLLAENYLNLTKIINQFESKLHTLENSLVDGNMVANEYINKITSDLVDNKNFIQNILQNILNRCENLDMVINFSNPQKIFDKGFCIMLDEDGNKITSATELEFIKEICNKKLKVIFLDGEVDISLTM